MHSQYGSLIHVEMVGSNLVSFIYFAHEEVVGFTNVCLMQRGNTPLYRASKNGHTEVVELLLSSGADINKVEHCNVSMHISSYHVDSFIIHVTLNCSHSTGSTISSLCCQSGG